ncbi:MAG TPA: hypothetical protein VGO50_05285 [Pyrinomonadaceae bacterium]|nr:hypothetical protein [Pyrinomonadaceae bacterium]
MKLNLMSISIFTLALTIFSLSAEQVLACDCRGQNPDLAEGIRKAKEKSTAVFVGEVVSIKIVRGGDYSREVRLKVSKSWKGAASSQITIMTGGGGGDCGYFFEVGKSYLIYAYDDRENLTTNICTRTTPAGTEKSDKEIKILNKLRK